MAALDPILIVDDEKDNLEALKRLLRAHYEVTACDSPLEALKLIQKNEYHVLVSDQRMPEMTGVEFLEKAKDVCPRATRILLTGYTDIESVIGAINRGNIYRYVAKPWDPEDLRLTLRQANEAFLLRREIEQKNLALAKSNEELKRALSDLTLLDKAKARFLSLVSHEMNTPLTVLSSFVSLIAQSRGELPAELQKAVASLSKAADRFAEIVGEVLTFVGVESDNRLQLADVDLEKETVEVVRELERDRAAKQVSLKLTTVRSPKARADQGKIRVALRHFLKDGILRSPKGKEILLEITRQGEWLCYRLVREGEPLPAEALSAFEPTAEPLHHHRNLGLGLAICRTILERHGGLIELEPPAGGRSAVCLKLPSA